ncbi:MAG: cytidylate kinase-like family protein [Actinomycetia bacterium]|nr:cytidylate kinase-like family protein [Actinomycetes bacterium]
MRYSVTAIEREYASGGREIGERLAGQLGVPCYNQEILQRASARLGLPVSQLSGVEESVNGTLSFGLAAFANIASGESPGHSSVVQRLVAAETRIINELAAQPCVIVGRGAAAILREQRNVLRVFVHADTAARVARATGAYQLDPGRAESELRRNDRRRSSYFEATTDLRWRDRDLYHLFLNSGQLGIVGSVAILRCAME